MKRLLKYSRPYLIYIILAVVSSIGGALANVWVVDILKNIIDESIGGNFSVVISQLVRGAMVIAFGMICSYLIIFTTQYFGASILRDLRELTLQHIIKMSPDYMEKNNFGDMVARMTSDIGGIAYYLEVYFKDCLYTPIMIVVFTIYLIMTSPVLALAGLFPLIILVPLSVKLMKPIKESQMEYVAKLGETNNNLQEICDGIDVVKSYNLEEVLSDKYYKDLHKTLEISFKNDKRQYNVDPISRMISELPVIIAVCLGGYLVFEGGLTIGIIVAFVNIMKMLIDPLERGYQLIIRTQWLLASVERVFYILDTPIEFKSNPMISIKNFNVDKEDTNIAGNTGSFDKMSGASYNINSKKMISDDVFLLRNVKFSYAGMIEKKYALNGIDLAIPRGKKTAFVGRSGCGKSTLLKLLYKHYEVSEGDINFNGVDVKECDPNELRNDIALISQDAYLFPLSIKDNIRIGKSDATQEEIIRAAKLANAHEFIEGLPNGYESMAGEKGTFLSGGQRQRISIARAILKEASIVLMDEPTSALDRESELQVNIGLDQLLVGKTVVVIAHRLPTIVNADQIVVIDEGRIIEIGRHEDLLKINGVYANLYTEYVSNGGVIS